MPRISIIVHTALGLMLACFACTVTAADAKQNSSKPAAAAVQIQSTTVYLTTEQDTARSVLAAPSSAWKPFSQSTTYPLKAGVALWVQMQLSVNANTVSADAVSADAVSADTVSADTVGTAADWRIQLPKPFIDRFELHPTGSSSQPVQTAGDNIANQAWPVPGLYPQVLLPSMAPGQHTVTLRIVNNVPANFQLQLLSGNQAQAEKIGALVNIIAVVVLLLCMMLVSACLSLVFRDMAYAWYSLYALFTSLFVLGYTGLASYVLWPAASGWPPSGVHITAALSVLVQMVFCYSCFDAFKLQSGLRFAVRVAAFVSLVATAILYSVIGFVQIFMALFLGPMIANAALIVWIVLPRLRQGDSTAALWLLAYLPLMILVALTAFDNLGFFTRAVVGYHWIIYSLAFEVPLLLLALLLRAKSRHALAVQREIRQQLDPLTGFVLPRAYQAVAQPMWQHCAVSQTDIAVAYVQVTQPDLPLLTSDSRAPGSQRIVRILRTVFRQDDTYAQLAPDIYAVLMPGKDAHGQLQTRLTRVVAQLHMLSQELKTDYPLRARVAVCTSRSLPQAWPEVHRTMLDKFNDEKGWNKRSIRMVATRQSQRDDVSDLSNFWEHALEAEANLDGVTRYQPCLL